MPDKVVCCLLLAFSLTIISCAGSISGVKYPTDRTPEIYVGMEGNAVKNILGEPYAVERYAEGEKWIWSYATKKAVRSFVVTMENGRVRSLSEFKDSKN